MANPTKSRRVVVVVLIALAALFGCSDDGSAGGKKGRNAGTSHRTESDGGADGASGDGSSGPALPSAMCHEDATVVDAQVPELLARDVEQELIAMGRDDVGLERLLGASTRELLGDVDAMGSDLIEATLSKEGVPFPARPASPPVPGGCGVTGEVHQALTDVPFYAFAYAVVLELLPEMVDRMPNISNDTRPGEPQQVLKDVTTVDGVTHHLSASLSANFSREDSAVTVHATLVKTITTSDASASETAEITGTVDICPDMGGVAAGKFVMSVDDVLKGKASGSSHLSVNQTFAINVDASAQTTNIELNGSMTFTSSGSAVSDIAAHGNVAVGPQGPPAELGNADISIDRSNGSLSDARRVGADLFPMAWMLAQTAEKAAKRRWRGGLCVEVKVDPPTSTVAAHAPVKVTATPHHKFKGVALAVPVVATLTGQASLSKQGTPVDGPMAAFDYVAGCPGDKGDVAFKSTSNRGIGTGNVTYTADGMKPDCPSGSLNPDTCMCDCSGSGNCPDGSTWDASSSTCKVDCTATADGTIAGFPCVLAGTMDTTVGTGPAAYTDHATVRLVATTITGCTMEYVPTGTVNVTSYVGCTLNPATITMSSSTLYGSFVVDISSSPFVNADLGVAWDAVLTCSGISTASSKHEVLWCHSGRQPVQRGSDFSGTYTDAGAITSTWSLKPSQ